jgi:RNA polymerase sigma factor (sigma-70 family)
MSITQNCFDNIYRNYYHSLLKVVQYKISNLETAEDVLQEAFIKIWIALPTYQPDKGSIYTWMAKICSHAALDLLKSQDYRRQLFTVPLEPQLIDIDIEYYCIVSTDLMDLRCYLSELREPCEEALLLYINGYTQKEIGQKLDLPLGTVKGRIRSGLMLLRERWV